MAQAKVDILGPNDLTLIHSMYNDVFKPPREESFFHRRFDGRLNPLISVASIDNREAGFLLGFELKPSSFFLWLLGVLPDFRRAGVGSQLLEAAQAWAHQQGYASMRFECHNKHRPMLHMAIHHGYDIVGIRWDPDRSDNLVILEKTLT